MANHYAKMLLMIIVALRRRQKPFFIGAAPVMLSSLLSLGCGSAEQALGPTEPTPGDATGTEETSLANQVQGTFIGEFQNPSMSSSLTDYQIIVTRIDDTSVRVAPASGSVASTFVANLESTVSGSVTSITLKAPDDILENNGTFVMVDGVGRLAYAYHLGGSDSANLEVFSGARE